MALAAASRLGHYNVTALLGEGGMGQVWQATDTQLNRQVALKILPDGIVRLTLQVREWADDEPAAQLSRIPLSR